jgi:hypothetical protein
MMMLMIAEMMMIALMIDDDAYDDVDNYSDDYDGDDVYQCGRSWLEHS